MEKARLLMQKSTTALWVKRQLRTAASVFHIDVFVGGLRNGHFLRNVVVVMAGSVIAQAIGFAVFPIVSRLFTPADFGVFASFSAVTGAVAAIVTLDYSQAIMLPKRQEDAGQVLVLSCLVSIAVTLLCTGICLLVPSWLLALFNTRHDWLLPLFVVAILAGGLNVSFQAWCVRRKAFKHTSASQVVRGLSFNGLQVGFGIAHYGAAGLLISSVLAELLASVNLLGIIRADLSRSLRTANWQRLKQLARYYLDFPVYSASQNLLNALSAGVPILLLTHFFDIAVAGSYALGVRVLNAPVGLIVGALRQVLFQKAGEMQHRDSRIAPLFLKSTLGLFALGLVPAVPLVIWSPSLFAWAFGRQWELAGEFARYLTLWLLFVLCNLPAVLFARLIRIQRELLVYNSILLALRVAALVIGGFYLTAVQSIALFSAVGAAMNILLILFVGRELLKREGQLGLAQVRDALGEPALG